MLTEQEANSISANANDDIKIISTTNKYPRFGRYSSNESTYDIDYIKSIEEPLPLMVDAYDTPISKLNNCFFNCASLVSIPEGLFDNNPEVTDFSSCFGYCSALTSIPLGLFDNNTNVNEFRMCFADCRNLTVNVQIGSTTTEYVNVYEFANNTAAKGTVYCRAGSEAYNAFLKSTDANVNVLTY